MMRSLIGFILVGVFLFSALAKAEIATPSELTRTYPVKCRRLMSAQPSLKKAS